MRKIPELERTYELMSALQKAVRWCEVNEARYFAQEINNMGKPGANINRLLVMTSEDVGLADPTLQQYIRECSDTFERMISEQGISKSKVADYPEILAVIDRAVIAAALCYKSRMLAMLTFITLYDIYKKEDFAQGLEEYNKRFRVALQRQDERDATYYAYIIGIFLKSERLLFEIVRQESEKRNAGLVMEWVQEYSRTKERFLVMAGIISLLCRDMDYPHGEYRDRVSDWLALPIQEAVIPDRAYDMHTSVGKEKGRGFEHFFREAASVRNERFPNGWEERGKDAWYQARKEGLKELDVIEAIQKRCKDYGGQEVLQF